MSVRLSTVKSSLVDQEITVSDANGLTFLIWYNYEKMTGELVSKIQSLFDTNTITFDDCVNIVSQIITKWELVEDDDITMIPITKERLLKMEIGVLLLIIRHVMEDQTVKKKSVKS